MPLAAVSQSSGHNFFKSLDIWEYTIQEQYNWHVLCGQEEQYGKHLPHIGVDKETLVP